MHIGSCRTEHKQLAAQADSTSNGKMNWLVLVTCLWLCWEAVPTLSANLTSWRHHRRQRRFLIFQDGGVVKLVAGTSFPVDFQDKAIWRQLVWIMNFHYQFSEPTTPIYWWNLWNRRGLKGPIQLNREQNQRQQRKMANLKDLQVDEPQQMLFEFAEQYMEQLGQNGKACLERLICENAQVHEHSGLYAQLLHRLLRPHRTLDVRHVDAYRMGRHGVNCRTAFPKASHCQLDKYVHVHERGLTQSYI